ncbi:RHS repeat-associated core domain-containing protein [Roseimaritima sediminicola]|uniref:RHS repeat-associated core domain-containing protein n=1 Tax=Roseimaritima sediminicola TaxID=2662066 RepID=UPI0012983B08
MTDRNGRVTTYEYDHLHRRTAVNWLDCLTTLRTLTYSYDAASQLASASDPAANYAFTYDNLGRNTSTDYDYASLVFDVAIDESYDALGRRTQLAAEINGTADLVNDYQYDYLNRMTQVTQGGQSGGNAVAEKRVDFAYDAEDKQQFTSITRYADLAGSDTVAISTYGYDDADRLTSLTHVDGNSGTLAGYTWHYDEGNRLTDFTVSGYSAEDATYSYDDTDQLTAADRSGTSADESYAYDGNGNRTGGGYATGDDNQISSDGTFNYTYDDEGNRLTKTNVSTGEVVAYSWDHRNRLTSITTKDSVGTVTHQVDYTYDIFNRRIVKTIDADGAGSGTATKEIYIHEGLREERDGAGDQILLAFDESGGLTERYLHGPAVDQVLASEDVTSPATAGDVLWALSDNLGSVRDIAEYDAGTDTTTVVNHLTYDAFGNITAETDASVDFLFAYTGRERDAEGDLQYNRARYYDAAIGRWISQDPIGFEAGDANLYRYVGNGTATATDSSGWCAEPATSPSGSTSYTIGPPTRPAINHDNGFLDHYDPRDPTADDRRALYVWIAKLEISESLRPWLDDAHEAYRHFLFGEGRTRVIDYEEYIREDEAGRATLDEELRGAQLAAEQLSTRPVESFQITGTANSAVPYPVTENWQKAIGGHTVWGSANVKVTCNPTTGKKHFAMDFTLHAEDRYNFNPGESDLATGIPDSENGKFEITGLARQYDQFGTVQRTVSWEEGSIQNPQTAAPGGR